MEEDGRKEGGGGCVCLIEKEKRSCRVMMRQFFLMASIARCPEDAFGCRRKVRSNDGVHLFQIKR